jgi:ABC-2 type transport system permease protein
MSEKRLIDKMHVGIVDDENSLLSQMLIENFKSNKEFTSLFIIETGTETTLMDLFHQNELSAIVMIPSDFTNSLLRFENTPLEIILNSNYPLQNTVLENIMASYSTYIKAVDVGIYSLYQGLKTTDLDQSTLTDINEKFSVNMVVTALGRGELFDHQPINTFPSATSQIYFMFAGLILLTLFMTTKSTSYLSTEIRNGTFSRFQVTGQSPLLLSISKMLVHLLQMSFVLLPIIIIFSSLLDIKFSIMMQLIALLLLSSFTLFMFFMNIGLLLHKLELGTMFSSLMTFILGIIGGQFLPIQLMPKFIQDLSSYTPNYWIQRSALLVYSNESITGFYIVTLLTLVVLTISQAGLLKRRYQ